jgi:aminoglycoside phosphotransferase (APT) family kinase protein
LAAQWEEDIPLADGDAARLIAEQFPELAPVRLEPLGVGWDNRSFLVDGRIVFRFPRRRIAVALLEREARILPLLAPHLPLPIPAPRWLGRPTAGYPSPFAGYPFLPGRTACHWSCTEADRLALAPALARFLAALHGIPIDAATRAWAPGDEIARADLGRRAPQVRQRLMDNPAGLDERALRAPLALVDDLAETAGWAGEPRWCHGDFYGRHLLLDRADRLAGVIDWGDVHLGDPALDLSIAFSFLPPAARGRFREQYGAIDEATWRRARFRALHYGALLTEYGAAVGDPAIRTLGEEALRFASAEP